jgi:proline iminopeptidase
MYPEIEPYASGLLDVGDGNQIYWETCGNPDGIPALAVHGGPGSGCVPGMRKLFDPDAFRIILFDQRGSGRSTPHVSDYSVDLSTNTTHHLVADMELLREHLAVSRWLLVGWSWGTTLALAYAERHPVHTSGLALTAVTTTGPREVEWITRDAGRFFPEQWARFRDALPPANRDGNLADGYARLLADADPRVRETAARDWCDWEASHVNFDGKRPPPARYADPRYRMCFARLVTHYWRHAAFLPDGELLRHVGRISHLPAVLIHGRLDLSGPPDIAWQLAESWPTARLHVVEGIGHSSGGVMAEHLGAFLDEFAATESKSS